MRRPSLQSLLGLLIDIDAPPGGEAELREVIRHEVEACTDEVQVSPLGNLQARSGAGRLPRLMLVASLDEPALAVTYVDPRGLARFACLGQLDAGRSVGATVRFLRGAQGVIGILDRRDDPKPPAPEELFIDFGVNATEACPVRVGDVAVLERSLASEGSRLVGRGLSSRLGSALLIRTAHRLGRCPCEVQLVFAAQGQVGHRGAQTAAFSLEPDVAILVDASPVKTDGQAGGGVTAGRGPAIRVRDRTAVSDPLLVEWVIARAEYAGIPYQLEVTTDYGKGVEGIQGSGAGVRTVGLGLPCTDMNTASEAIQLEDLESASRLLLELVRKPYRPG
jgi:putative aminopeptidase FrvX